MKNNVKHITPPSPELYTPLSALEMNGMHFSMRHTVLTAAILAKAAAKASAAQRKDGPA